jgi:exopolyphosphatase/pppGpp-phosphohydrolase
MVGLRPERADVIPCGVLILTELLKTLNVEKVTVSEMDNMEGYFTLKGKING